MENKDRTSRS